MGSVRPKTLDLGKVGVGASKKGMCCGQKGSVHPKRDASWARRGRHVQKRGMKGRVGSVCPKRDVSRPEGVGESKNGHEGAGWGRCVQKGDTSQPKGDGWSKNGMIWGQKGRRVQKRGRMGPMHPKMGRVVSRRAGGESVRPN